MPEGLALVVEGRHGGYILWLMKHLTLDNILCGLAA
jgi:hypothetical protein